MIATHQQRVRQAIAKGSEQLPRTATTTTGATDGDNAQHRPKRLGGRRTKPIFSPSRHTFGDSSVTTGARRTDYLRHNTQFQLLWIGSAASALGSNISLLAFPLLVLSLTGSPAMAGVVSAVGMACDLIFSLPAGVCADRWDRRRVLLTCEIARAALLASIAIAAWANCLTFGHIVAVAAGEEALGALLVQHAKWLSDP